MAVMKYVMMELADGTEIPVLFPSHITHKGMAQALTMLIARESKQFASPISAGFVNLEVRNTLERSESLSLEPKPGDVEKINAARRYDHWARG